MDSIEVLSHPNVHIIIRIFVSVILGCLIGIEREIWNKSAGLRTHILVCLGSTVFTLLSIYGFSPYYLASPENSATNVLRMNNDPARIAAQILTGIGFIGGGAVLHHGGSVYGLTTAASLWITASIGMAVGTGSYTIAIVATIIALLVLGIVGRIERGIFSRRRNSLTKKIKATIIIPVEQVSEIQDIFYSEFKEINQMTVTNATREEDLIKLSFIINLKDENAIKTVYDKLKLQVDTDCLIIQHLSDN